MEQRTSYGTSDGQSLESVSSEGSSSGSCEHTSINTKDIESQEQPDDLDENIGLGRLVATELLSFLKGIADDIYGTRKPINFISVLTLFNKNIVAGANSTFYMIRMGEGENFPSVLTMVFSSAIFISDIVNNFSRYHSFKESIAEFPSKIIFISNSAVSRLDFRKPFLECGKTLPLTIHDSVHDENSALIQSSQLPKTKNDIVVNNSQLGGLANFFYYILHIPFVVSIISNFTSTAFTTTNAFCYFSNPILGTDYDLTNLSIHDMEDSKGRVIIFIIISLMSFVNLLIFVNFTLNKARQNLFSVIRSVENFLENNNLLQRLIAIFNPKNLDSKHPIGKAFIKLLTGFLITTLLLSGGFSVFAANHRSTEANLKFFLGEKANYTWAQVYFWFSLGCSIFTFLLGKVGTTIGLLDKKNRQTLLETIETIRQRKIKGYLIFFVIAVVTLVAGVLYSMGSFGSNKKLLEETLEKIITDAGVWVINITALMFNGFSSMYFQFPDLMGFFIKRNHWKYDENNDLLKPLIARVNVVINEVASSFADKTWSVFTFPVTAVKSFHNYITGSQNNISKKSKPKDVFYDPINDEETNDFGSSGSSQTKVDGSLTKSSVHASNEEEFSEPSSWDGEETGELEEGNKGKDKIDGDEEPVANQSQPNNQAANDNVPFPQTLTSSSNNQQVNGNNLTKYGMFSNSKFSNNSSDSCSSEELSSEDEAEEERIFTKENVKLKIFDFKKDDQSKKFIDEKITIEMSTFKKYKNLASFD